MKRPSRRISHCRSSKPLSCSSPMSSTFVASAGRSGTTQAAGSGRCAAMSAGSGNMPSFPVTSYVEADSRRNAHGRAGVGFTPATRRPCSLLTGWPRLLVIAHGAREHTLPQHRNVQHLGAEIHRDVHIVDRDLDLADADTDAANDDEGRGLAVGQLQGGLGVDLLEGQLILLDQHTRLLSGNVVLPLHAYSYCPRRYFPIR